MRILIILILLLLILLIFRNKENFTNDKQYKFKKCLSDMRTILNKNNIHFFLCWGTLLGQHRENKFIEHDHDIDIGILNKNFDLKIIDEIENSGLFIFKKKFGKIDNSFECSFIHKETNVPIDIFIFYNIKNDLYYTTTHTGKCDNTEYGFCKWARHLRGFKNIMFFNELYSIPKNTEEYLVESYGKNWRIPKKFNYYEALNNNYYKNLI